MRCNLQYLVVRPFCDYIIYDYVIAFKNENSKNHKYEKTCSFHPGFFLLTLLIYYLNSLLVYSILRPAVMNCCVLFDFLAYLL